MRPRSLGAVPYSWKNLRLEDIQYGMRSTVMILAAMSCTLLPFRDPDIPKQRLTLPRRQCLLEVFSHGLNSLKALASTVTTSKQSVQVED
jgi:hypothetical protein